MTTMRAAITVLGFGRVGTSVALSLAAAGEPIAAVGDPAAAARERAIGFFGRYRVFSEPERAAAKGSTVLVAVPDSAVDALVAVLAGTPIEWQGRVVLGFGGLRGAAPFGALGDRGACCGAMHPLKSFAADAFGPEDFTGTWFGVSGAPEARAEADRLARVVGGDVMMIEDGARAAYHAAAAMAANHTVGLMDLAAHVLAGAAGVPPGEALKALLPLVRGCLDNIERLGLDRALTGPVARGEADTVKRHIEALAGGPRMAPLAYCALSLAALEIAARRGDADAESLARLRAILENTVRRGAGKEQGDVKVGLG